MSDFDLPKKIASAIEIWTTGGLQARREDLTEEEKKRLWGRIFEILLNAKLNHRLRRPFPALELKERIANCERLAAELTVVVTDVRGIREFYVDRSRLDQDEKNAEQMQKTLMDIAANYRLMLTAAPATATTPSDLLADGILNVAREFRLPIRTEKQSAFMAFAAAIFTMAKHSLGKPFKEVSHRRLIDLFAAHNAKDDGF